MAKDFLTDFQSIVNDVFRVPPLIFQRLVFIFLRNCFSVARSRGDCLYLHCTVLLSTSGNGVGMGMTQWKSHRNGNKANFGMGMGRNWNWLYGNVREPECKKTHSRSFLPRSLLREKSTGEGSTSKQDDSVAHWHFTRRDGELMVSATLYKRLFQFQEADIAASNELSYFVHSSKILNCRFFKIC